MQQPLVGSAPEYTLDDEEVPWVLGTQLTTRCGPLSRAPKGSRVLLVEAHDFARRKPYHHHKLTLLFAAMRQFRDRLEAAGYDVIYKQSDTFADVLREFFAEYPDTTLVAMRSPSHGSERRFREIVTTVGGTLRVVENELFASTPAAFDEWANGEGPFRHEQFYRFLRRESGVLMDDDEPIGGEWNYDDRNREVPPPSWDAPPIPEPEHYDLTRETAAWVAETFDAWGDRGGFCWPVTRSQAREHLDHFLEHRLPSFGPYQDAMRADEWAMSHTLLSSAVNVGLLHPTAVIQAVENAYNSRDDVPLASAEGCIRQLLGWREFVRHVYNHAMPDLATANQLDAHRPLPEFYWSGETDMNCLAATLEGVRKRGYAHHIQRLMVLSNFATLWGVEPSELNEWFHATFVDAYHWVTTPNVVEMGQYGQGVFATKPYVSSGNYLEKMSDYCSQCQYDQTRAIGDGACPFNALYWDFLDRNEEQLRSNHRMALMYGHLDDKRESGDRTKIRERVADLRESLQVGTL